MEKRKNQPLDESKIPKGSYCYTPIGYIDGHYKIIPCPYWDMREDKPHQNNGYCHFLKRGDWEAEHVSLLWDQVKECGINEGLSEKEEL